MTGANTADRQGREEYKNRMLFGYGVLGLAALTMVGLFARVGAAPGSGGGGNMLATLFASAAAGAIVLSLTNKLYAANAPEPVPVPAAAAPGPAPRT